MKEIKLSELMTHMGSDTSAINGALESEATHLVWNGHHTASGKWEVAYVGPKLPYRTPEDIRWRHEQTEHACYALLPDAEGLRLGSLDYLVHDVFSEKASAVNNDGYLAQLECLREAGTSWDEIVETTKRG